eukprot:GDKJ01025826.1.p1 GENE.GDKJ01025826.1~~GDKJ01025826.1.p1  ORF type:complete len:328 (+),score=24.50 GDKJ01025826.1:346-1329(+)
MKPQFLVFVVLLSLNCFSQNKFEVFFDFNQDIANEASQAKINQWIAENKTAEITKVLGYCDSVDSNDYNKQLAMRRIHSMLEIFKKEHIKIADKVELKSFGEDFKYSKIQSENRKVEVFYSLPMDIKKESDKETKTAVNPNAGKVALTESKPNPKPVNKPQTLFGKTPGKQTEAEKVTGQIEEEVFEPIDMDAMIAEEKAGLALKFEKAKVGDLIRISNIIFHFNSEKVMDQSVPLLNELLQVMLDNPGLRIAIHGHICCNPNPNDTKLSYRRALVILKYLTGHGVEVNRLDFKGFGSNNPIYKVPEKNEKQRMANRRVEILIVQKK